MGGVSMAEVALFHSVLGRRPGVIAAADRLRAAGHTLHAPDLYDGEVFDDLEEDQRKEEELGYCEIARRAREAVAELPAGLVFVGFSLGAVHAELLAASRPGALGAVLMHGTVAVEGLSEFFGVERWPAGVPVQVHYAAEDPWVEAEEEVAPSATQSGGSGPPSGRTRTRARATSSPIRTCPSTTARPRRRCGSGCSPSSIRSTSDPRASRGTVSQPCRCHSLRVRAPARRLSSPLAILVGLWVAHFEARFVDGAYRYPVPAA
jgi:predicted esterase